MNDVLLKLSNIAFSFPGRRVFRNINIEFGAGEVVVLLGNNGCGKSTLLKICTGFLCPQLGEVFLCGTALEKLRAAQIAKKMIYMPQHLKAPELFSVRQFMQFGFHGAGKTKAALERFDVSHFLDRECISLSGGEWTRVQLARVFAQTAEVFLFDEPTAGLDLEHIGLLARKFRDCSKLNNCSIVVSTHDLNFALAVATRVVALDQGQCVWNEEVGHMNLASTLERLFHVPIHWIPSGIGKGSPAALPLF